MNWRLDIAYSPVYELLASLHAYISRNSYKKLDLTPAWAEEVRGRLEPSLEELLQSMKTDDEWKSTYLLAMLCPAKDSADGFLDWAGRLNGTSLRELFAEYSHPFPDNLDEYLDRTLAVLQDWNDQYFRHIDPAVHEALAREAAGRNAAMESVSIEETIDETTNGLSFRPIPGVNELLLIPQYHFQPINIIYHFDNRILCNYNARLYFGDEDLIPTPDLRLLRSLGEKNRLKILRYLQGGPRTFIEIVRHLKLSKGITHDHLNKLRSAGLLYAHLEGENLVEYSIRTKRLYDVQDKLIRYIIETP